MDTAAGGVAPTTQKPAETKSLVSDVRVFEFLLAASDTGARFDASRLKLNRAFKAVLASSRTSADRSKGGYVLGASAPADAPSNHTCPLLRLESHSTSGSF